VNTEFLIAGVVWYVVFLLSTTCHEAAHAWAAQLGGDLTPSMAGRSRSTPFPISAANPLDGDLPAAHLRHGGWMMGWRARRTTPPGRNAIRAGRLDVAGRPRSEFHLAILAGILIHIGIWTGNFRYPESANFMHVVEPAAAGVASGAATFVSLMFSLNLLLGTFNLIPGRAGRFRRPRLAGPRRPGASHPAFRPLHSAFSIIGLLLVWQVFGGIFQPVFSFALRALYPARDSAVEQRGIPPGPPHPAATC